MLMKPRTLEAMPYNNKNNNDNNAWETKTALEPMEQQTKINNFPYSSLLF